MQTPLAQALGTVVDLGLHAATHPDLAAVDEAQIRLGEGPGPTALRQCRTGPGVVELPVAERLVREAATGRSETPASR